MVYRPFNQSPEYRASEGKGYEAQQKSQNQYNMLRRQALDPLVECVSEQ